MAENYCLRCHNSGYDGISAGPCGECGRPHDFTRVERDCIRRATGRLPLHLTRWERFKRSMWR